MHATSFMGVSSIQTDMMTAMAGRSLVPLCSASACFASLDQGTYGAVAGLYGSLTYIPHPNDTHVHSSVRNFGPSKPFDPLTSGEREPGPGSITRGLLWPNGADHQPSGGVQAQSQPPRNENKICHTPWLQPHCTSHREYTEKRSRSARNHGGGAPRRLSSAGEEAKAAGMHHPGGKAGPGETPSPPVGKLTVCISMKKGSCG